MVSISRVSPSYPAYFAPPGKPTQAEITDFLKHEVKKNDRVNEWTIGYPEALAISEYVKDPRFVLDDLKPRFDSTSDAAMPIYPDPIALNKYFQLLREKKLID